MARQSVAVSNADVVNLQVQLQPLVSIPVQIDEPAVITPSKADLTPQGSSQPQPQRAPVMVQLIPNEPSSNMRQFMSRRQGDAPLTIPDVPGGNYRATVQTFGSAECLETISAGGVDLSRSEYNLADGAPPVPIHVTLRSDCASVKGTVRSPSPNPTGTVLLLAKNLALTAKMSQINSDGSFSFMGLSPGDYQLYALSSFSGLEYDKPDSLHDLSGQDVHLDPSQSLSVSADLIVRGDPP